MDEVVLKILDNVENLLNKKISLCDIQCTDLTITYKLYNDLNDGLIAKRLNIQHHLPQLLQLIDTDVKLPVKISNLTRKVQKVVQKSNGDSLALEKPVEGLYDSTSMLHTDFVKSGVKLEDLTNENFAFTLNKNFVVKNEHVLNLRKIIKTKGLAWKNAASFVNHSCHLEKLDLVTEHSVWIQWNRLQEMKEKLHRDKNGLEDFLNREYKPPSKTENPKSKNSRATAESTFYHRPSERYFSSELQKLYREFQAVSDAMYDLAEENAELSVKNHKLAKLQIKYNKQKSDISKLKEKISEFKPNNVKKRIDRRDQKITFLSNRYSAKIEEWEQKVAEKDQLIDNKEAEINQFKGEIEKLTVDLEHTKNEKINAQKLKSYYKRRNVSNSDCDHVDKEMKEKITSLENENEILKEQLDEAIGRNKEISMFSDGKYDDSIRLVYMDLLSMGVSIRNCENVVRTVLENLMNVKIDRLPKKTLCSMMSVEAQIIAQAQAAEEMLKNKNNTIHLDGTKKNFHEYGGFQVSCKDGKSYSLGHPLMLSGTADSYIDSTKSVINELAEAICEEEEEQEETGAKLIMSIKNIMTDRHVVNKSYHKKFEDLRVDVGKKVIEDWDNLTDEEKQEHTGANSLFCGLHVIVNMATAAVKGLSTFEKDHNIINSYNQQPVATELVREVAKAFMVTSGDMKSGDALDFSAFLDSIGEKFHYITFKHNRFNVLFHDAGALYYHRNHIKDYLSSGKCSKQNKLIAAIKTGCENDKVLSECRALGLIGKVLCGPLWRILEKKIHIFEVNQHWHQLKLFIEQFFVHPEDIIKDVTFDGEEIQKDVVYQSLVESPLDEFTQSAIKALCKELLPLIERQLSDQLPGGKYYEPSESLVHETSSARATNRTSEADFSDLDRSIRNAPQKSHTCRSGLICFKKNKTSKFITKLGEEKKKKYLNIARTKAKQRQKISTDKVKEITRQRIELMRIRQEKKNQLYERKVERISSLKTKIQRNGVWLSENQINKELNSLPENKRESAIKEQINFHKLVLKSPQVNPQLYVFSKKKRKLTLDELKKNLIEIIKTNFGVSGNMIPEEVTKINEERTTTKRKSSNTVLETTSKTQKMSFKFEIGKFYAIAFTDNWYVGECIEIVDEHNAVLSYMHHSGSFLKWPNYKKDKHKTNIQCILDEVEVYPSHGGRCFDIQNKQKIQNLFENH